MSKEIYISSTPHETRLAIVEKDELTEIYYERENEYTLAGSIYNGRVTRVLPGMQSSFVDIGLERDAFLYITDFMEEAPDSAEFDTSSTVERAAREPRAERPQLESGGEVRAEGSSELPRESRSEGRRDGREGRRDGRGDGRSGGRSRGRRDGRNRNRQSTDSGIQVESVVIESPAYSTPDDEGFYSSPAVISAETPRGTGGDEIGEGAPGADGTRRWRGRRGRRRGRGLAGEVAGSAVESNDSVEIAAEPVAAPQEFVRRDSTSREASQQQPRSPDRNREPRSDRSPREGGRERGGRRRGGRGERSPEVRTESTPEVRTESTPEVRSDRGGDRGGDRNERAPRRDRGGREGRSGRDDRGNRGERGNRDDRTPRAAAIPDARHDAIRERFAPRGPRHSAPNEETIDLTASAAPARSETPTSYSTAPTVTPSVEPFILPGESLSKYRRNEPGFVEAAPKPTVGILVTAKPSSEIAPLVGWDGGATLPGETLSRRPAASSEPRTEARAESRNDRRDFDRGADRGGERSNSERGERSGRGGDRRRGRDGRPRGEGRSTEPRVETQAVETTPTSYRAEPRGLDPAEAVQPAVTSQHDITEAIYESQIHASQHEAEVVEAVVEAPADFHEAVVEFHETTSEYEPGEDASASFRVDPAGTREFRQSAPTEEVEAPVEHAFTSIQPTGEMLSEVEEVEEEPATSSPIEHETVVQSVSVHESVAVPFESQGFDEPQGFAPGDGELEEEELDEEETEVPVLQASVPEEVLDEEALAHAADLGQMIRDRSIDDLAGLETAGVEEEEDEELVDTEEDFEEDELESSGEAYDEDELGSGEVSEAEEAEFAETAEVQYDDEGNPIAAPTVSVRSGEREGGRRGRRDGRRGGRDRGGDRGRERSSSSESDTSDRSSSDTGRERSSSDRGGRDRAGDRAPRDRRGMANSRDRRSGGRTAQSTNLPSISDLLKPGQEILVQIAKEPIAKKGARITSHIALPGRFLVFMPTVSHTGVSRKIESDAERRRLKEILLSERGDASGGFIVRTAAAGASEEDLRSDLRFLLNLWAGIKERSEASKSPALIYHDLNLIERILRDQVTDNFSAIWCDTEAEYERVIRFLQRFQPALVRRVKLYSKDTPLFEQYGINAQIDNALRAKVWLKSGGSIVINQTEALVAIDINTGKYVGKTAKLEDTILKTNLDAIPEIVRQMRLRDLGGIIIIDFIDMDERKNRNKVMAALEEELKKDRAPSKVLPFNDFGLVAITRKRVKQTLERTLSTTCGVCAGTGMVKSPVTVCNDIYIEMRKMYKLIEKDIMLRVHPEVVKQLKLNSGKWLTDMEQLSGKTILLKSDPSLHPEQFDIH